MEVADPDAIHIARMALINSIEASHRDVLQDLYHSLKSNEPYRPDAKQSGQRALRNACLRYLTASDTLPNRTLAFHQFRAADNMTDAIAALSALTDLDGAERNEALQSFYEKWKDTHLVVDKWMSVQAMTCRPDALAQVEALMQHPAFTLENPNRARSLIYAFAINNPLRFHAKDGSGYRFAADRIIDLDKINPQVAARLVGAFETWRKYDAGRQETIAGQLKRVLAQDKLSRNVSEMAGKTLG
jgi:aminopeptidase N